MTHKKARGVTDTWITPVEVTNLLGQFDLDPATHTRQPWQHATFNYTYHDDGLRSVWFGRVWLKPPYFRGEIDRWVMRFCLHGNGCMLIPASVNTKRFHEMIVPSCDSVLFFKRRVNFANELGEFTSGNGGQDLMIVNASKYDTRRAIESGLGVTLKLDDWSQISHSNPLNFKFK